MSDEVMRKVREALHDARAYLSDRHEAVPEIEKAFSLLDLLDSAQPAPPATSGWKLMPPKLSPEMLAAMHDSASYEEGYEAAFKIAPPAAPSGGQLYAPTNYRAHADELQKEIFASELAAAPSAEKPVDDALIETLERTRHDYEYAKSDGVAAIQFADALSDAAWNVFVRYLAAAPQPTPEPKE